MGCTIPQQGYWVCSKYLHKKEQSLCGDGGQLNVGCPSIQACGICVSYSIEPQISVLFLLSIYIHINDNNHVNYGYYSNSCNHIYYCVFGDMKINNTTTLLKKLLLAHV
jgi:hypothetical protein